MEYSTTVEVLRDGADLRKWSLVLLTLSYQLNVGTSLPISPNSPPPWLPEG